MQEKQNKPEGKEALIAHVSYYHSEVEVTSYACPKCRAKFQSQVNLVTHMQACGSGGKVKKEEVTDHADFIDLSSDKDVVDLASSSEEEEIGLKRNVKLPVHHRQQASERPLSQAVLQAEEMTRRGLAVSVVTREQEELAEMVKEVETAAKEMEHLAEVIRQGENFKKTEVKGRMKEVLSKLDDVNTMLGFF